MSSKTERTPEAAHALPQPSSRLAPWLVVGLALALRLCHFFEIRANDPFHVLPGIDGRMYHEWAQRIAAGDWLGSEVFFLSPLYPYLMGVLYSITGPSLDALGLLQAILGALACWLVWRLGTRLFEWRVGLVAGLLLALSPMAIFFGGTVMIVNVQVPLVLAALLATVQAREDGRATSWLLAGGLVGISALARPTLLLYAPVVLCLVALDRDEAGARRALGLAGAFCLGIAVTILPVTARNQLVGHDLVLLNSSAGPNLYMGNGPDSDGTWRPPSIVGGADTPEEMTAAFTAHAEREVGRPLRPSEVSSYWREQTLEHVGDDPAKWLGVVLRKWLYFFNAIELWNNRSFEVTRHLSWVLRLPLPSLGWVMPLALFGLMISFGRWRERLPLYAVVIAYFAEASIFFVLARYRMPAVPVLMLFAAHGGLSIWDYLRAREWRMLATSGYTVAALAWLVNWNIASPNLHSAWFGMGVRYQELDRLDAAVDSYGRCLAIYEDHVQARYNLAIAYEGMGRHDAAVDAWRAVHDWARRNGHAVYLRESEARLLALGAGPS